MRIAGGKTIKKQQSNQETSPNKASHILSIKITYAFSFPKMHRGTVELIGWNRHPLDFSGFGKLRNWRLFMNTNNGNRARSVLSAIVGNGS